MKFQNPSIQELKIMGLNATVLLKVVEGKAIEVQCDNPEVQIKEVGQAIVIADKDTEISASGKIRSKSVSFFSKNGRTVINSQTVHNFIIGNNVIINGNVITEGKETPSAMITISVPYDQIRYLDLSISGICRMGEIAKKLSIDTSIKTSLDVSDVPTVKLDSSGVTHAMFRNIHQLEIDSSGQSFIDIQNVKELSIDTSGQSEIDVKSDSISELEVDASGMANIQIETKTIEHLEADLSGMSNLLVFGQVLQKQVDTSGMSRYMNK